MSTKRACLVVSFIMALAARSAFGDPATPEDPCPDPGCHFKNGGTMTTPRGTVLTLPPGYFLDEPTFDRRDVELKAAQDLNTRLKAENDSFRKSADEIPWKAPVIAGGLGIVIGVVLAIKYL